MLKLGIIGTSWISHEFITAAHQTGHYHLHAVYSRKMKTAQEFCEPYGAVSCYTDFIDFLDSELDVIYIASPNSLHFAQAKHANLAKKHVIIEKPSVTTPSEWTELVKLAKEHQVYLFEAARNYQEAAFQVVKDFLSNQEILGANFTFAKYSSKLPALLAGEMPNIFSDVYAGGALMDLGVYCLYLAIGFFGTPISSHYTAQQLPNSVDLYGQGVLIYPDFQVAIQVGKNITSHLPAEIYTKTGTLTLNAVAAINQALISHSGEIIDLPIQPCPHQMQEEAEAFALAIAHQKPSAYLEWLQTAEQVHETLYQMRQSARIQFKDEKE